MDSCAKIDAEALDAGLIPELGNELLVLRYKGTGILHLKIELREISVTDYKIKPGGLQHRAIRLVGRKARSPLYENPVGL